MPLDWCAGRTSTTACSNEQSLSQSSSVFLPCPVTTTIAGHAQPSASNDGAAPAAGRKTIR